MSEINIPWSRVEVDENRAKNLFVSLPFLKDHVYLPASIVVAYKHLHKIKRLAQGKIETYFAPYGDLWLENF